MCTAGALRGAEDARWGLGGVVEPSFPSSLSHSEPPKRDGTCVIVIGGPASLGKFTLILDGGVPLYGNYSGLLLVKPCVRLVRQLPTTSFFPPFFFFFRSVRHKRPAR